MNHNDERKAFDVWHLKQFKDINDDLNNDEAEHLYQRVYSHESQDLIRQMEFNAWLSSANREGYKLVPVELIKSCNDIAVDCFNKWDIKKEAMPGICELMQDFSYYLQSHDRSL